jgi:hypothetical protein
VRPCVSIAFMTQYAVGVLVCVCVCVCVAKRCFFYGYPCIGRIKMVRFEIFVHLWHFHFSKNDWRVVVYLVV